MRMKRVFLACLFFIWGCYPHVVIANENSAVFEQIMELAQKGDAEAQYHLGMFFNNGLGVTKDPKQAFEWFGKSAEANFPLGQYKLGCYYDGQFDGVVVRDKEKALRYKLNAAEAGYMLAQNDVAAIYMENNNPTDAFRWVKAAAEQGHSKSLYNVSMMYKDGIGTPKNLTQAYAYFKLAKLAARGVVNDNAKSALKQLSADMSDAEVRQAEAFVSSWKANPTLISQQALQGLGRAQEYLKEKK